MPSDGANFLGLFGRERNVQALAAGATLFREGDAAHAMYVVLSGEVCIGAGNVVYEQVGAGGLVGEMALIDHAPRSATVTAVTDATVAEIDERRFVFLVQQTPSFALNVMRVMSHRLRRMNELART